MIDKTKKYAISKFEQRNILYDDKPYEYHLSLVNKYANKYRYLLKRNAEDIIAASWTHDTIEDCGETYNDVLKQTNKKIADLSYALTNEKGRNRSERANDKYYRGIRREYGADYLKICDRMANVEYSKSKGSRMFDAYSKENNNFVRKLKGVSPIQLFRKHEFEIMFNGLKKMF